MCRYRQKWATAMQQMDVTERRLQELQLQTEQDRNSLDHARKEFEAEQRAFNARKEREQKEAQARMAAQILEAQKASPTGSNKYTYDKHTKCFAR